MSLVVDASVAIKWFVIESSRDYGWRGVPHFRGAHAREDFPARDDVNWMKHTLASIDADARMVAIDYRPVHGFTLTNEMPYIEPKPRVY